MAKQQPTGRRAGGRRRLYIAGAAFALSLVAVVILLGNVSLSTDSGRSDVVVVPTQRPQAVPRNGTVYGEPDAAVTISEYLDFQCPVCRRAGLSVLPEIEQEYVEPGRARLEVRTIAFLGDESVAAAEAAQCADEQGRFWEYHDILFANQGRENSGAFSEGNLKRFAEALGLQTGPFNACLDSGRYESSVKEATDAAMERPDFKGTPTFLVNGQEVETSVDAISAAIDAALSSAP
jgi:protein-disulfide isomerase